MAERVEFLRRLHPNPLNGLAVTDKTIMLTIILVIVLLMALGALPTWPYSQNWGYFPSGGLGLVLVIVVILLLAGRL